MIAFLKNIPLAFYSADYYRELATKGKGIGLSLLLFVTLVNIAGIVPSMVSNIGLFTEEQKTLFSVLPDMQIKDGTLTIQGDDKQTFTILK